MSDAPNFLFFITDQHRADWLGCMGHPVVKTPNIDAIAAAGTRFTDFHVASPVCMPNRASLMTGRMPSTHGTRYNGCPLPETANTFADVLRAGGYETAMIGKSHLQPFTTTGPFHGKQPEGQLISEAWKSDPADYRKEQPSRYASDDYYDFPTPYYGFSHVEMATGHGDKAGGHYNQWFRKNWPNWRELCDASNELPHNFTCPQAYRTPIPEEAYPTTWIGDRAIDFLQRRKSTDDPFLAMVSFPDPHHPFNPPGKYWNKYSPDAFEITLPFEAHQNPTPPMEYLSQRYENGLGQETPQSTFRASPQQVKEAMALTAGMITMIDDQIGRVVEALKANGQYDNTVILFTSDHGDYLGDYEMVLKGALPFRAITRVPMIWSDPADRQCRSCDALSNTIDISASILDRAGLAPYNGIQGQSFLPSIHEQCTVRDSVFIEYNDAVPRTGFSPPARVRSLVTKSHRMTFYQDQNWGELYDLEADPNESRNLWDDPDQSAIKSALTLQLLNQMTAAMDTSPLSELLA